MVSASFGVVVLGSQTATGAVDTVTNCDGSGPGSLPAAVGGAASGDTISFSVSCPPGAPIALASTIDVNRSLTIDGPGPGDLAVSGEGTVAVFDVDTAVEVNISGLTIEDGLAVNGGGIDNQKGTVDLTDSTLTGNAATDGGGGGIYNNAMLTVTDSTLEDNTDGNGVGGGAIDNHMSGTTAVVGSTLTGNDTGSADGAGIENTGTLSVTDSSVTANNANGYGAGLDNDGGTTSIEDSTLASNVGFAGSGVLNSGSLTMADSTVADNSSPYADGRDGGSGMYNDGGTMTIANSTLWANGLRSGKVFPGGGIVNAGGSVSVAASIIAESGSTGDCSGPITDLGYNLDDDGTCGFSTVDGDVPDTAAGLDPAGLEGNGGPTETIALDSGSAAIGAVASASMCSTPDQRGVARPTPCDTGAVDVVVPRPEITSPDTATATSGAPFTFLVTTSGAPIPTIVKRGHLPRHVTFVNNRNGTATLSGVPKVKATTAYHLEVVVTFGKARPRLVLTQSFTLTVDPD